MFNQNSNQKISSIKAMYKDLEAKCASINKIGLSFNFE